MSLFATTGESARLYSSEPSQVAIISSMLPKFLTVNLKFKVHIVTRI